MSRIPPLSTDATPLPTDLTVDPGDWWLWALVGVAFVLDVGLTSYGVRLGFQEANPLVRSLFPRFGVLGSLFLMKGAVVAVGVLLWVVLPLRYRPVVPLGMALPWLVASAINVGLILTL